MTLPFLPPRKCAEARAGLFKYQERSRKQFSRSSEARASMLSVRKEIEGSFHHCGGPVKLMQACLCVGMT